MAIGYWLMARFSDSNKNSNARQSPLLLLPIANRQLLIAKLAFTPLMKRPDDVSAVEWVERCHEQVRALDLDFDVQNNLLLWQWILSGLIVDPAEIKHLVEENMFESSTYRYIFEQVQQQTTVKNILSVLDVRFGIGTDETLQISLEEIEDLQRLEALLGTAVQTDSVEAFRQTLTENGK